MKVSMAILPQTSGGQYHVGKSYSVLAAADGVAVSLMGTIVGPGEGFTIFDFNKMSVAKAWTPTAPGTYTAQVQGQGPDNIPVNPGSFTVTVVP